MIIYNMSIEPEDMVLRKKNSQYTGGTFIINTACQKKEFQDLAVPAGIFLLVSSEKIKNTINRDNIYDSPIEYNNDGRVIDETMFENMFSNAQVKEKRNKTKRKETSSKKKTRTKKF
jgi:hypothetical protein